MAWWRRGQKDDAQPFHTLLAGIVGGSSYGYGSLVRHLISTASDPSDDDREEVEWLGAQDPTVWRRIEAAARDDDPLYGALFPPDHVLRDALAAQASPLLASLVSLHRSGYLRETAVDILRARREPVADRALALRTSDWVDVVRGKARAAVLSRIDRGEALAIVPFLVALVDQERSRGVLQDYLARLPSETVGDLARFGPRLTRRLLVDRLELSDDDLMQRATQDDDPVVRSRATVTLLARRPDSVVPLLRSRSAVVVQLALDAAPDDLVRERIDLLIDPRATVRGAAQRRLTKIGTDVLGHYQECVAAPNAPAWAVVGLAETGGRRVAEQLVELMRHPSADVRRGALRAARWSLSGHALTSLAAVALHDESELVVRAAARVLRRDVPYVPRSVVTDLQASESRWLQVAGLRLARRSDSWTRLEAALRMAADADPALAREGRADLSGWHPHGIPTAEQRETVLVLVTSASLDAATERRIRFYCGRAP